MQPINICFNKSAFIFDVLISRVDSSIRFQSDVSHTSPTDWELLARVRIDCPNRGFRRGDREYIFMNRLAARRARGIAPLSSIGETVLNEGIDSIDRARSWASNGTALIADGMLHRIFIGFGIKRNSDLTTEVWREK